MNEKKLEYASDSMKDCLSKIDTIEELGPKNRDKGTTDLDEAEQYFTLSAKKIKAAAPRKSFNNFITFVEDTYKCSGMCEPSLFFYSQSIEMGPPT